MGFIRSIIRVLVTLLIALPVIYVIVRVYWPELIASDPTVTWFLNTNFGRRIDNGVSEFAAWAFQNKEPGEATAEFLVAVLAAVYVEVASTTFTEIVAGTIGAVAFGALSLLYNWWRNRPIRKMCSRELYVAALKIDENLGALWDAHRVNGKKLEEVKLHTDPAKVELTLKVNDDIRSGFHRLKSELESLRDFSIAYDYAFWRGLRTLAARMRMQASAAREAIEAIMAELDRDSTSEVNLIQQRFFGRIAHLDGLQFDPIPHVLADMIDTTIQFAGKLEWGRSLQWMPPVGWLSIPRRAAGLRDELRPLLQRTRAYHRRHVKSGYDDDIWLASANDHSSKFWEAALRAKQGLA